MKLPSNGAGGLDGWKPMDLKRLGSEILGLLVHLFDAVEKCGRCPHALCRASISLIRRVKETH